MSKLGCVCGHVIVDQIDQTPYKASFITDVDLFDFYDAVDGTMNTPLNHKTDIF
ncbi:hypothetical protein [Acinetobacter modestus]|uniref:hypothetical protein n=1 Tax=Acinetobacter modestus TaxID=1776740 RepID=UPI0030196DF5